MGKAGRTDHGVREARALKNRQSLRKYASLNSMPFSIKNTARLGSRGIVVTLHCPKVKDYGGHHPIRPFAKTDLISFRKPLQLCDGFFVILYLEKFKKMRICTIF